MASCDRSNKHSIEASNRGAKAFAQKQFETAISEYKHAVELDRANHAAWYALAVSYQAAGRWVDCAEAAGKAVAIKDDEPMYQMLLGVASYEKAVTLAREALAKREDKKPAEVTPDLASINFETALQHLQQATKANAELWETHYYLGQIYRNTDRPQEAAMEFTKAIQLNPFKGGPYIALVELYRAWDFAEQAIQVAQEGSVHVKGSEDQSRVWMALGLAHNDKRQDDKAIEAFTKAIAANKGNHPAKFQRGQSYYRSGADSRAKADLDEFSKAAAPGDSFYKAQASKILMEIAAKEH
jgi:tetratricopeptide (TPR) repeat protein